MGQEVNMLELVPKPDRQRFLNFKLKALPELLGRRQVRFFARGPHPTAQPSKNEKKPNQKVGLPPVATIVAIQEEGERYSVGASVLSDLDRPTRRVGMRLAEERAVQQSLLYCFNKRNAAPHSAVLDKEQLDLLRDALRQAEQRGEDPRPIVCAAVGIALPKFMKRG